MTRRLYRSQVDHKIAGVCGGVAEYYNVDPTLVRIVALALIFLNGIGLLAYIIAWIAMPKKPLQFEFDKIEGKVPEPEPPISSKNRGLLPGIILIAIGGLILMHNLYWWWFEFEYIFPVILILIGIALLVGMIGRKNSNNPAVGGLAQEGMK